MTTTDAHTDVGAEPRTRHGRWAGFFIILAVLVLALSASPYLVVGIFITLLSVGLVFLAAELRRPSS